MLPLLEKNIRASLINASLSERKALTLPPNVSTLVWDNLDYLGWRDPKIRGIGYVIVELEDGPVGILVRQAKGAIRTRPQCSWCDDVRLPNDVVFFSTKRAGQAGRNGNTIATLACANFECSANVRKLPPVAYLGFDVQAARLQRIDALREHVRNFVREVRDGS
ncbi:FBP domain-containing protein [Cryobacterium fucosi]|uniref:FBP domain-containing protein n=1 Tax=Cryobacterium fucosi TaxID=1259157 RepID=A0A4R9BB36_9MICO|nr:FBP domain-containing protein [Cryobacterium fucosi]TFD78263.1 FBP domain-containing protein [Cryobacterium fucosi]